MDKTKTASPPVKESKDTAAVQDRNEGEGSQSGAKAYRDSTRAFVESGKVPEAARKAVESLSGPEAADLKRAEAEGKSHARPENLDDMKKGHEGGKKAGAA